MLRVCIMTLYVAFHLCLYFGMSVGISKLSSKDGKALTDPEVLHTLTSSVSGALDEAAHAINCMRMEHVNER